MLHTTRWLKTPLLLALLSLAGNSAYAGKDTEEFQFCLAGKVAEALHIPPPHIIELPLDGVSEALPRVLTATDARKPENMRDVVRQTRRPIYEWIGRTLRKTNPQRASDRALTDILLPGQKYNYIVTDKGMALSKTSKDFFENNLSKHYMLASNADKVHYGGEIWIDLDGVIHMNNASGSFAPSSDDLAAMARVIEKNFGVGGIEIHPFVKAAPPEAPQNARLPALPSESANYDDLFAAAKASALQTIDLNVIQKAVDSIAKGNFIAVDEKTRLLLKQYRKSAMKLRSAYNFLSATHEGPQDFEDFVKAFGVLNDSLALRMGPLRIPMAKRLQKILKRNPLADNKLPFLPTAPENFQKNFQHMVADLKEKLAAPGLTFDDFHEARKTLRDFRNFYLVLNETNPKPEYEKVAAELDTLSTRMGAKKDRIMITNAMRTYALRMPARATYQISPEFRTQIEQFLQQLPE